MGDGFKEEFPLHPETVMEAIEKLHETGDTYNEYLASELAMGWDNCEADLSDFRGPIPPYGKDTDKECNQ